MIEIITLFNQAEVHHSQNWMFFIVVVFGVLGYCFTEKYKKIETLGIVILAIGLIAFSIYNGDAMVKDVSIYNSLLDVLQHSEVNNEGVSEAVSEAVKIYEEKKLSKVLVFHILASLLVFLVIIRKYLPGIFKRSTRDKIVG